MPSSGKRRLLASVLLSVLAAACGGRDEVTARWTVDLSPYPPVEIEVRLTAEHAPQMERYLGTADATLVSLATRFGPAPFRALTIVDPGWNLAGRALPIPPDVVVAATRWIAPGRAMEPEVAVADAVGRRYWQGLLPCADGTSGWFVDGITRSTVLPAVESRFAVQQIPPAFAYWSRRYFGGFLPWLLRIPLRNASDGNRLADYRSEPTADPLHPEGDRARRSLSAKTALALGTMDRWLGRATWDAALAAYVHGSRGHCASPADLANLASGAVGIDLSWYFDPVFSGSRTYDYALKMVASKKEQGHDGAYRTTVVVTRIGDAAFPGTSTEPDGPFESGRGVRVRTRFEDGAERLDAWDGRGRWTAFEYVSASPAVSASVDPDRVLLLDAHATNNTVTTRPRAGAASSRWAARWMVWLDDFLLNWAALV